LFFLFILFFNLLCGRIKLIRKVLKEQIIKQVGLKLIYQKIFITQEFLRKKQVVDISS